MDEPSVELVKKYRLGDDQAATELFRRYVGRLTVLARARMSPRIAKRFDPEDVVLSAYRSFFVRARNGKFSLEHSGDLWRLLVGIVLNKLYHQVARHTAEMRSVDRERPLPPGGDSAWSLIPALAQSPTAEQAVEMADLVEVFMGLLDSRARRIFELRLHNHTIGEIATAVKLNERTVRRLLVEIESRLRGRLLDSQQSDSANAGDGSNELPEAKDSQSNAAAEPNSTSASDASNSRDVPSSDLMPGNAFFSDRDFVIEMHLGTGGTGRVYRARSKSDGRLVAIKMLRKVHQRDPAVVARFLDEARTVARLNHPAIVAVQGIGRTRGGGYFLVHDLVCGQNLAEIGAERPIAVAEAVEWVVAAAAALDHAQQNGVIHCDLKPANLLLDSGGQVRVTDFGLAHIVAPGIACRAAIAGTFGYMAPEQLDSAWGQIGPHTDVFGLGAVLYALLTGRAPFSGKTIGELMRSMLETVPKLSLRQVRPDVPAELEIVIRTCLALNPRDRVATAGELADRLREFNRL